MRSENQCKIEWEKENDIFFLIKGGKRRRNVKFLNKAKKRKTNERQKSERKNKGAGGEAKRNLSKRRRRLSINTRNDRKGTDRK